jgi:thiol:disulfide interchange protein
VSPLTLPAEKLTSRLSACCGRSFVLALLFSAFAFAQGSNHVNWTLEFAPASAAPGAKVLGKLTAKLDPGWHLYSLSTPPPPIATTIKLADNAVFSAVKVFQPPPVMKFDQNFNTKTETFEDEPVFLLELEISKQAAAGVAPVTVTPRYQVCSDKSCIPPRSRNVEASFTVDPKAASASVVIPKGYVEPKVSSGPAGSDDSIAGLLAVAFGFGLAAIFTPCVFPMIPITMSFFLNQENVTRRQSLFQAGLFCLGIIVLFTGLGLLMTSLLGPLGVVQLGSNPWVNGLICVIFLVFGLSLLGAFEITIPSFILTGLNSASQGGGVVGTLLMGLTFSLASFACVGPFVGTLLAASAQSGGARPAIGMLAFSMGLALPFFLLAIFPSYLKKLPRSGGWLARVKVVMGFVIIAAMLKYLSSIDQVLQWGFLTRDRFLAAWIVLFAMPGLYLLGMLRMEGVKSDEELGLGRLLSGIAFLIFSIALVPGMFGSKLGELDAYVPVNPENDLAWMKNDLPGALAKARAEGKKVLVNFTGYACTNCHWMKANMFTRPEIAGLLKNFVLVDLYTDGTDEASQINGKLEEGKFGTIQIPFYVIYDADQNVVATFPTLTRNPSEYIAFLNTAGSAVAPAPALATNGSELDAMQITTVDGGTFDRSAFKGKAVVVDFWATWCVPCRKEIPGFNKLATSGVAVVGVSMDEDGAGVVKKFLKEFPMKYPVALGAQSNNDLFKITQLPTTIVFDKSGKAIERFEGLTDFEKIEEAVKKAI